MRPNEQKYKNKGAKKKPKKLKQADEFLFERRMRFFISRSLKFLTILSVLGIVGVGIYLYKSEKYILVAQYFDNLTEKFFIAQGMRLEQIEVRGNEKVSEADILNKIDEVLKNLNSSSLTHLPMEDIKQNIELLGWVKSAEITKLFPNKLIVRIIERTPKAIWQDKKELWLVDEDGNLVTDKITKQYVKLPVVVSQNPIETIPDLFQIIKAHEFIKNKITSAVRVGNRRWDIYLKNGVIIKLPEKDVEAAIERLIKLQNEKSILDRSIKHVDLRLPDRIAVKKLSEKDFINEKPPISLSSAYTATPKTENSEPAIAEDGQPTNTKNADASKEPAQAVNQPMPAALAVEKVVEQPVAVTQPPASQAKTESKVISNKSRKPASLGSRQGNVNVQNQPAPQAAATQNDHEDSSGFFNKMDALIGN